MRKSFIDDLMKYDILVKGFRFFVWSHMKLDGSRPFVRNCDMFRQTDREKEEKERENERKKQKERKKE